MLPVEEGIDVRTNMQRLFKQINDALQRPLKLESIGYLLKQIDN